MSINREKLNAKFESEFKRLNKEQAHAVETLEGPVMVIAGPGTGKTQILASRIGKILLDTDAAPDNILCLTYTDAGVVAMRRRLQEMIGPEAEGKGSPGPPLGGFQGRQALHLDHHRCEREGREGQHDDIVGTPIIAKLRRL